MLSAKNVSAFHGGRAVVDNVTLSATPGELHAVIGPNGAGKTSLLRLLVGLDTPRSGSILLNGRNLSEIDILHRSQNIAFLPQLRPVAWPMTVRDVVALGRYPHGTTPIAAGIAINATQAAMDECAINHLANRRTDHLSGGELARVHIARTLATGAPIVIADEPTASLDPAHKIRILMLMAKFAKAGKACVVVLHDIELAAQYASRITILSDGKMVASGIPRDIITTERLASVFGINASIATAGNNISLQVRGLS